MKGKLKHQVMITVWYNVKKQQQQKNNKDAALWPLQIVHTHLALLGVVFTHI